MENHTQIIDASATTSEIENDFFGEVFVDSTLLRIALVVFFIGLVLGLILELGIIWYERNGNHPYRTVINQLFSTRSWVVVFYILCVCIPNGLRYLIGPLDATFCDIHNFVRNFVVCCAVLTWDCIILLRCIFIFKLSNFAVVNDDLIATFLHLTILLLSLWITTVKRMSVGRPPLNYFICIGKNPNEVNVEDEPETIPRQYLSPEILCGVSFFLHLFAFTKIFLYQRKVEQMTQNIELGRIDSKGNNGHGKNGTWANDKQIRTRNLPKSMEDFTTQMIAITFIVVLALVQHKAKLMDPARLNEYNNRWLVYFNQLIGGTVAMFGITVPYYLKNSAIPKAIWRNIKEQFNF